MISLKNLISNKKQKNRLFLRNQIFKFKLKIKNVVGKNFKTKNVILFKITEKTNKIEV